MMELVVLGDPVAHSLSPAIHRAAMAAAGIAGRYSARRVGPSGVMTAMAEMRTGALHGANITMPHKRLAASLPDELTPPARRAGSVNTWLPVGEWIVGDSTDGAGVRFAWARAGIPDDARPLILGGGGAAAAALIELEHLQPALSTRRPGAAVDLLGRLRLDAELVPWGQPIPEAVVVNATPIGMNGERLPPALLSVASGLIDMAYGPTATPSVLAARSAGLPVGDGLEMLVGQAAASFRLWTGVQPDIEAMLGAAKALKHAP